MPTKNNTVLTVSQYDADSNTGRQPSLTSANHAGTSFIGDIGGFQDVVVLTNGTISSATSITLDSTKGIVPGMTVTGTGISGTVTVSSLTSATVLVLSSAQTVANDVSLTFSSVNAFVQVIDLQAEETDKNTILVQGLLVVNNITTTADVYIYVDDFIRTLRV